jgi:hypothetical protein
MRWLARVALAALSSVVSVFMACAYGTPWRYVKSGRVVGAGTSVGIPGIQVGCALGGELATFVTTEADGQFTLGVADTCDDLRFTDVDGAANGEYQAAVLPFTAADEHDLLVELDPVL